MLRIKTHISAVCALVMLALPGFAQDVWITPDKPFVELEINNQFIVIERNPDKNAVIPAAYAKTSRACPPFCVQPITVAEGVNTVGELEVLSFLENVVQAGKGLLIDARIPSFYHAGTIPGAINLPFTLLSNDEKNPFLGPILTQLGGVKQADGTWSFENATELMLFCNGPWCGQSPRAIHNLLAVGYPADKLHYYRGGMQDWLILGLTVVVPEG